MDKHVDTADKLCYDNDTAILFEDELSKEVQKVKVVIFQVQSMLEETRNVNADKYL